MIIYYKYDDDLNEYFCGKFLGYFKRFKIDFHTNVNYINSCHNIYVFLLKNYNTRINNLTKYRNIVKNGLSRAPIKLKIPNL